MHQGRTPWFLGLTALAALAAGCVGSEPTLPTAPECASPLELCDGSCVDTSTDALNCGACGASCDVAHGGACAEGSCGFTAVAPCAQGTTACGELCVDTQTSAAHCGDCATACDTAGGEVCASGSCALSCAGGTTECDGGCVNTTNDPGHCGKCGNACSDGQVCSEGKCALACSGGASLCGKSCVDFTNDPLHCGDCKTVCDTSAGERCEAGRCTFSCTGGTTRCGDACVDTNVDPAHCGGCDVTCGGDATCSDGKCACADGYAGDGQTCVDIDECAGDNDCGPSGVCINTAGGYACACRDNQAGDGKTCTGLALVTVGFLGTASTGYAFEPVLSDDGRYVAFASTGADFADGSMKPPGAPQAYERDMAAKTPVLLSLGTDDAPANQQVNGLSISGDGALAVFDSDATNLDQADGTRLFVHDFSSDSTVGRAVADPNSPLSTASQARFSRDGGTLVFTSNRPLPEPTDSNSFVYRSTGPDDAGTLVSVNDAGDLASPASGCGDPVPIDARNPGVSGNGARVVFSSSGVGLTDEADDNCSSDVFLRDYSNPKKPVTRLLSANRAGVACTNGSTPHLGSTDPVISADGNFVAFDSNCTDLLATDDQLDHVDVFVRDLTTDALTRVSVTATGAEANGDSTLPQISADGRYVAFRSTAGDLVARDTNGTADVFVRDMVTKKTVRVNLDANGAEIGTGAGDFALSSNGAVLAFQAFEPLLPQDRSEGSQIYLRYLR